MHIIDLVRTFVRAVIKHIAAWLNHLSNGRISPNGVTMFGFLMHIPIALVIIRGDYIFAAVLLVFFGLFDTLDGELARLQLRASPQGMLLDALTDRLKEVILYTGIAVRLNQTHSMAVGWCVLACGASLSVSYVKAKGESAVASQLHQIDHHKLNYMFKDGLMSFEIRMTVLVLGLLVNQLLPAVIFIAVSSLLTVVSRYKHIVKELKS
jgi:CDP-diacylglycerol--glycerol-3-phosphate 3-phosphatidyltransferase